MSYEFNAFTGNMDLIKDLSTDRLESIKLSSGTIPALRLVTLLDEGTISLATNDSTHKLASVYGMSESSASSQGQEVCIIQYGIYTDASFTFADGDVLFLGLNGSITSIPPLKPVNKYNTIIGRSLGNGSIIIDIRETEEFYT